MKESTQSETNKNEMANIKQSANILNKKLDKLFESLPSLDKLQIIANYLTENLNLEEGPFKDGIESFINSQYYWFIEVNHSKAIEAIQNTISIFGFDEYDIYINAKFLLDYFLQSDKITYELSNSTILSNTSFEEINKTVEQINKNRHYYIFSHHLNFQFGFLYYHSSTKQFQLSNIETFQHQLSKSVAIIKDEADNHLVKDSPLYNLFYAESHFYQCAGLLTENSRYLGIYNFNQSEESINNTIVFDETINNYSKVLGLEDQLQIALPDDIISHQIILAKGLNYLNSICIMIGNAMHSLLLSEDETVLLNTSEIKEKLNYTREIFKTKITLHKDVYLRVCINLEIIIKNIDKFIKIEESTSELKLGDQKISKSEIKKAISENRFVDAIDMLIRHFDDTDQANSIYLIKSGYNQMNIEYVQGTLKNHSEVRASLNNRVLVFADLYLN